MQKGLAFWAFLAVTNHLGVDEPEISTASTMELVLGVERLEVTGVGLHSLGNLVVDQVRRVLLPDHVLVGSVRNFGTIRSEAVIGTLSVQNVNLPVGVLVNLLIV